MQINAFSKQFCYVIEFGQTAVFFQAHTCTHVLNSLALIDDKASVAEGVVEARQEPGGGRQATMRDLINSHLKKEGWKGVAPKMSV